MMHEEITAASEPSPIVSTVRSDGKRIAIALMLFTLVMAAFAALQFFEIASRMQPQAETVVVEPLFKYGDDVLLIGGFYRGCQATVIGWDEEKCEYTVSVGTGGREGIYKQALAFRVPEAAMKRLPEKPET